MKSIFNKIQQMRAERLAAKQDKQTGASMIEYAILVAVVVGAAAMFAPKLAGMLTDAGKKAEAQMNKAMDAMEQQQPGAGG